MLEGLTCVYRSNVDLFFYVIGSANENEVRQTVHFHRNNCSSICKGAFSPITDSSKCTSLMDQAGDRSCMHCSTFQLILVNVLNCLYDTVSHMLRKNVEKKAMFECLDGVYLAIDEICDNGYINISIAPKNSLCSPVMQVFSVERSPWIVEEFVSFAQNDRRRYDTSHCKINTCYRF